MMMESPRDNAPVLLSVEEDLREMEVRPKGSSKPSMMENVFGMMMLPLLGPEGCNSQMTAANAHGAADQRMVTHSVSTDDHVPHSESGDSMSSAGAGRHFRFREPAYSARGPDHSGRRHSACSTGSEDPIRCKSFQQSPEM